MPDFKARVVVVSGAAADVILFLASDEANAIHERSIPTHGTG